jgi:hypothetical protein
VIVRADARSMAATNSVAPRGFASHPLPRIALATVIGYSHRMRNDGDGPYGPAAGK